MCKISNKKEPYAQISNGEKFVHAPKKQVISQLIENKKGLLYETVWQHVFCGAIANFE